MQRYLIELSHDDAHSTCVRMLWAFDQIGSHFLTRADWGCRDGVHKGWLTVDVESRDDALAMIPPPFRSEARVVQLNQFTRDEIEEMTKARSEPTGASAHAECAAS